MSARRQEARKLITEGVTELVSLEPKLRDRRFLFLVVFAGNIVLFFASFFIEALNIPWILSVFALVASNIWLDSVREKQKFHAWTVSTLAAWENFTAEDMRLITEDVRKELANERGAQTERP